MAETVAYKYRAFISYSHADTAWAKWLHRGLEGFRVDNDLVGRETTAGAIPKSLRPIFRDRDDFTAGHALTDQTLAALDASAALIVICSLSSAKSAYVTEEIRLFKSRHPARPVIPLIVDGKPGDPDAECFPPALKFKLDAKGRITKSRIELLAADAREDGDGKNLALAKVIAGLLGVSSDDIFRRAERERRRKQRSWIAGLSTVAVLLAGLAVWAEINRREAVAQRAEAERNFAVAREGANSLIFEIAQALRDQQGMRTQTVRKILGTAGSVIDKLVERSEGNLELQRLQAAMLDQFSLTYAEQGDSEKREEAARKAIAIMKGLTAIQPNNDDWQRDLSVSYVKLGDVLTAQGDLAGALAAFEESLAIRERIAKAHPGHALALRDVTVTQNRIGDVLKRQGKLGEALPRFRDAREIRQRIAKLDPNNTEFQRDLVVAAINVGDLLEEQGDHDGALKAFREALSVSEGLANADPGNAAWQKDLAMSHERIGNIALQQGDLPSASMAFGKIVEILGSIAKADPGNLGKQRDLATAYEHLGDVQMEQGDIAGGRNAYQDSLAVRDRLAAADPGNAGWQRDLAVGHSKIGKVLARQGDGAQALSEFREARAVIARLMEESPDNVQLSKDLAEFDGEITKLEQPQPTESAGQPEPAAQ